LWKTEALLVKQLSSANNFKRVLLLLRQIKVFYKEFKFEELQELFQHLCEAMFQISSNQECKVTQMEFKEKKNVLTNEEIQHTGLYNAKLMCTIICCQSFVL
jgi:hypothetical protein